MSPNKITEGDFLIATIGRLMTDCSFDVLEVGDVVKVNRVNTCGMTGKVKSIDGVTSSGQHYWIFPIELERYATDAETKEFLLRQIK